LALRKRWESPKAQFRRRRAEELRRGMVWELTYEQWWRIWQESGHWTERGSKGSQYGLFRLNPEGPFSVENVAVQLYSKVARERIRRQMAAYQKALASVPAEA
jgi:hypothetical protein